MPGIRPARRAERAFTSAKTVAWRRHCGRICAPAAIGIAVHRLLPAQVADDRGRRRGRPPQALGATTLFLRVLAAACPSHLAQCRDAIRGHPSVESTVTSSKDRLDQDVIAGLDPRLPSEQTVKRVCADDSVHSRTRK